MEGLHPDDRDATQAEIGRLRRGEMTVSFENRFRCKDGSWRTLVWSAAADQSGLIFAAAHDITERKRVEAERIELNRLLTQRNQDLTYALDNLLLLRSGQFGDAQRLLVHFNFTFAAYAEFIVGLDCNCWHKRNRGEHNGKPRRHADVRRH